MMNAKQMAIGIGKRVNYRVNGMLFEVKIMDVRTVWNRTDILIQPVSGGSGMKWVSFESCEAISDCRQWDQEDANGIPLVV